MEYDELKHFEKLLDEFEEDTLAVTREGKVFPSSSRKTQRDLTRRNVLAFVEGIVLERDQAVNMLNVQPKGAVAEKVAP